MALTKKDSPMKTMQYTEKELKEFLTDMADAYLVGCRKWTGYFDREKYLALRNIIHEHFKKEKK